MATINSERLADTFITLCEIDSPSKREGRIAAHIKGIFTGLGAEVIEDGSAGITGSESGNLLVRFVGSGLEREPVFFNCHLDTVQPGDGVRVKREGRIFSSQGETILGADDKSGIAVLIEVMRCLQESGQAYGPVELLFTTCEEMGLRGAKAFDCKLLRAGIGYALDTTDTDKVIIGAPAARRLQIEVTGVSSHAGLAPEQGINAILLAAKAIAELHLGRLDEESTANIGLISGGIATNIVPDKVRIEGEVRSHNEIRLAAHTDEIEETFMHVIDDWTDDNGKTAGKPALDFRVREDYPLMKIDMGAAVIKRIEKAAVGLARKLEYVKAGGGSDANIFNSQGVATVIIGTGMKNVHTIEETIDLDEMVRSAELVMAILTV